MIDRIRHDIQTRLDQLLSEADRLRQALHALGGDGGSRTAARSSSSARSSSAARSGSTARSSSDSSAAPAATRTRSTAARASRARSAAPRRSSAGTSRAASGGTKNSVLKALGDADGKALTASEVAAATGLGRASVSTTLSKLARAGEVEKADRGYRLATASSNGGAPAAAAPAEKA
jgi:RNA polymerase primary sigma factor